MAVSWHSLLLQNLRSVSSLCGGVWVCGIAFLGIRLMRGICSKAVSVLALASQKPSLPALHAVTDCAHVMQWTSSYTNPAIKRQLVSDWKNLQVCHSQQMCIVTVWAVP